MSFKYGTRSMGCLRSCHPYLQRVAMRALAITPIDIAIICGIRSRAAQEEAYAAGVSKVRWPHSKHNGKSEDDYTVSHAFDFAPWINGGIDWRDTGTFYMVVGVIRAAAAIEGVRIRCGADWDCDGNTRDQTFHDLGHIELLNGG